MDVLKKVLEVLRPILNQVKNLLGLGFNGIKGVVSSLTSGGGFKSLLNGENIRQKIVTALLFFGVLFSFTRCGGDDAKNSSADFESTSVKSEVANHGNSKTLYHREGAEADVKTADELAQEEAAEKLLAEQEEEQKKLEAKANAKAKKEKIEAEKLAKEKAEAEAKFQKEMDAKKSVWLDERTAGIATAMEVVQEQNEMIAISRGDLELQKQHIAQEIGAKSDILEKILGASALLTTKQAAFETDFSKSQESIKLKFAELQKARELFEADRGNFDETKAGIDEAQSELEKAKTKLAKDIEVFELEKSKFSEELAAFEKQSQDLNATRIEFDKSRLTYEQDLQDLNSTQGEIATKKQELEELISKNEIILQEITKAKELEAHQAEFDNAANAKEEENANEKFALLSKVKEDLNATNVSLRADIDSLKADLNATKADLEKANESVKNAGIQVKTDLESANAQLDILKADLNATKVELEKANESVKNAGTQAKTDLESANAQLDESKKLLESTKIELSDANQKLQDASDAAKVALVAATAGATKCKLDLDKANEQIQRLKTEGEVLLKEQQTNEAARLEASQLEDQKKAILEKISLADVKFKYNSTELYPSSQQRLNGIAAFIKENSGYNYEIQGHTDARGRESYNLKLSASRAEAVKAYLVGQGVDGSTLTARGFGSSVPIADNSTNEGRLKNRRVVFEILD